MYVRLYEWLYVHTYVRNPVTLRLRHLYQVEFCSFIVRYPTAGASVYCGHISSFFCLFAQVFIYSQIVSADLDNHYIYFLVIFIIV